MFSSKNEGTRKFAGEWCSYHENNSESLVHTVCACCRFCMNKLIVGLHAMMLCIHVGVVSVQGRAREPPPRRPARAAV